MKFIHLTDPHLVPRGRKLWGLDPLERFDRCLADIAAHHKDAEFCVITGDLADKGDEESYRLLKGRLDAFDMPSYLLIGNHDHRATFTSVLGRSHCDAGGFVQRSIDVGNWRLLVLDTVKDGKTSAGAYCASRRAWLSREIAAAEGRQVILFMHHPPFDIGHPLMDLIKLDDPDAFHDIVRTADVRHLFFGHGHRPVSGQWRRIPFSAVPSINHQLPLAAAAVPTVYSDEPPMYAVVMLEADRTVVHLDAFLDRRPAVMLESEERGNWY